MIKDSHQNIYIELDALLDTRLGTLWRMHSDLAEGLLYKGYHKRMVDNFTLLDSRICQEDFEKFYAARDVETLKNSRVTNIVYLINRISVDLEVEAFKGPHVDGVEITINTFPYKLTAGEDEMLKDMVSTIVGPMTGINTVHFPASMLTPRRVKENYSALILYHFRDWLKGLDPQDLIANKFPRIKIIAPAIYESTIPTAADLLDKDTGITIDPFGAFEIEYIPFFSLVFTDIRFFSIVELA